MFLRELLDQVFSNQNISDGCWVDFVFDLAPRPKVRIMTRHVIGFKGGAQSTLADKEDPRIYSRGP